MKLRRLLASAYRNLRTHRGRSLLALASIAVGVAAVVVSGAIGAGAEAELAAAFARTGTNLLMVKPLPVPRRPARPTITGLACTLRRADAEALATSESLQVVAPSLDGRQRIKAGPRSTFATVRGTTPEFLIARRFEIGTGRFFTPADDAAALRVAVLGARLAAALAPGRSLIGEEIRVGGVPFMVVGVLLPKGPSNDGADQDSEVLVPLATAARRVFNRDYLSVIYTSVRNSAEMDAAAAAATQLLRRRHQLAVTGRADDFAVQNTAKSRSVQQELVATLSRYTGGLAGLALVVGGVGILGLMLLTVRERTGEIGLRVAVGARARDIFRLFLFEAVALAGAGWLAGIAGAGATALAMARLTGWTLALPVTSLLLTFGTVLVIGLGFGAWPARNAARIPPIQALQSK
jgi:putative ABC transport system permease protein